MTAPRSDQALQSAYLLVLTMFFVSGSTGLIYEILWTRMIIRIIGAAPFAVAIVLTIFMAGLGLGSWLAGKRVDEINEPGRLIRLYGLLEIAIGAYGLLLPLLLAGAAPLLALIYNQIYHITNLYTALTFIVCAVLLLAPVICMGATLPILSRFYVTSLSHLGTHVGRLYGLNTIGAAFGALITGFWLIYQFGVWGTLAIAVVINVAIGFVCLKLSRRKFRIGADKTPEPQPDPIENTNKTLYPRTLVVAALVVFAVSGFSSMAYEVIWTKLLGLLVGPTTYSFTLVLVTFILGLAHGAMLFGWLVDRLKNPVHLLIGSQVLAAAFALMTSQIIGNGQLFFAKILFTFVDSFGLQNLIKGLAVFVMMLPPTICLGATFPLVTKIYTDSREKVGRSIGTAYAINTIGAVLGSFCAGFILIPTIGKETALSLVSGFQIVGVLFLITVYLVFIRGKVLIKAAGIAAAVLVILAATSYPDWQKHQLALGKYHRFETAGLSYDDHGWWELLWSGPDVLTETDKTKVLFYGDGVAGVTAVIESYDIAGNRIVSMLNSGKPEASNLGDMPTQTMLAHFPMLFTSEAKSVMLVGLASGITAGQILHYPVERLDVIEISDQVITASDYFKEWNNDVLSDPRTNLIIQDARAHIAMTNTMYDVIISEPSNPWMAGLSALFTTDWFEQAARQLNERGMMVQFIHSYQMNWESFSMVGHSFSKVFPNSILVSTGAGESSPDFMMIGFKSDYKLSLETATSNLPHIDGNPYFDLRDARAIFGFVRTEDLASIVADGRDYNSDFSPKLEFMAPRAMYREDSEIGARIRNGSLLRQTTTEIFQELQTNEQLQLNVGRLWLSMDLPFTGSLPQLINWEKAHKKTKESWCQMLHDYGAEWILPLSFIQDDSARDCCRLGQIARLEMTKNSDTLPVEFYSYLGKLYIDAGHREYAEALFQERITANPSDTVLRVKLASLYFDNGNLQKAFDEFREVLKIDPTDAVSNYHIGFIFGKNGQFDNALLYFNAALLTWPDYVEAHFGAGATLMSLKQTGKAIEHFETVLKLRPGFAPAQQALQRARSQIGR